MQRFKHLRILGEGDLAKRLLEKLKTNKGKTFEYNRPFTEEYAKNIFRDVTDVGCFKTSRVSLYASNVWVLFDKDHLYVTNITSEINSSLSKTEFNHVLDTFLSDFVQPFLKGEFEKIIIQMSPGELTMRDLISEEAFQLLNQWQASYDKYYQEEDFVTYSLWIKSIVVLFKNEDSIEFDDLREWLVDDCGWPKSLEDKIHDFYLRYEVGKDVLNEWKDENER